MIIKFGTAVILSFLLVLLSINRSFGQAYLGEIKCVCIDPGHGGRDPGAVSGKNYEKNIVLPIALKVGKLIKQAYPNIKVIYTRDKDVFIELEERTRIANSNKADLFISIHANALDIKKNPRNKAVKGMETFILGLDDSDHNLKVAMKENSAIHYEDDYSVKYDFDPSDPVSYIMFEMMQDIHLEKSTSLASFVQKSMINETKLVNRDVRQGPFWVLKDVAMPSILVEVGFISNIDDQRYIMSSVGQTKISQGIFKGFQTYKASVEKSIIAPKSIAPKSIVDQKESVVINKKSVNSPVYAVQIVSAASKIKNYSKLYTGQKVNEILTGGRYRYYVAASSDLGKVQKDVKGIRATIKDCFIIAIYKGNLISVAEAKKLKRK